MDEVEIGKTYTDAPPTVEQVPDYDPVWCWSASAEWTALLGVNARGSGWRKAPWQLNARRPEPYVPPKPPMPERLWVIPTHKNNELAAYHTSEMAGGTEYVRADLAGDLAGDLPDLPNGRRWLGQEEQVRKGDWLHYPGKPTSSLEVHTDTGMTVAQRCPSDDYAGVSRAITEN